MGDLPVCEDDSRPSLLAVPAFWYAAIVGAMAWGLFWLAIEKASE